MRSATRRKLGKDPAYLVYIRSLPCCVCAHMQACQTSQTEAAHIGPRGLSQKCPDRETAPLCAEHHRLNHFSQHSMGRFFWGHHDMNREELLATYQAVYDSGGVLTPLDVLEMA